MDWNFFRSQNEDKGKVKYSLALIVSCVIISDDISIVWNCHCAVLKHTETKYFIEKGFFLCSNVSKVIETCDGLLFQASSSPVHRNWTELGSREEARWNLARRMRFSTRRWPFTSIAYFLNVLRRNPYLCEMESSWSENANEGTRSIKLVYIADNLREQEVETFSSPFHSFWKVEALKWTIYSNKSVKMTIRSNSPLTDFIKKIFEMKLIALEQPDQMKI